MMYYRRHSNFLRHTGLLSEFLHYPDTSGLLQYVIIACYRKMRYRLQHDLSKPYWEFLRRTANVALSSEPTGSFPQFTNITLESPKPKQLRNDHKFFFTILPNLLPTLRNNIPQLLQALSEPAARDEPIKAYNEDTYMEFHTLLWELLNRFNNSLDDLHNIKDAHEEGFDRCVNRVMAMGDALQAMAGGYVIEVHMKVITMALDKSLRAVQDMDQETEWDEEIYQLSSTHPMWKAYCEWLKLIVVSFDAVRIVTTYLQKVENPEVTIKVIIAQRPDRSLMPWKELVTTSNNYSLVVNSRLVVRVLLSSKEFQLSLVYLMSWRKSK